MVDDRTTSTSRRDQDYAERLRQYEIRKKREDEQLRQRDEQVKQRYADQLPLMVERCGVYDEDTRAIAVGYLTKNIAAHIGTLDAKELSALARISVSQAYKFEELQRTQLQQEAMQKPEQLSNEKTRLQLEPRQGRYYAELNETHRTVREKIEADQAGSQGGNNLEDHQSDRRSHLGRYADLGTTHRLVDLELRQHNESTARQTLEVEQTNCAESGKAVIDQIEPRSEHSDSKRETDDRAVLRQARLREFGYWLEEGFHNQLDQDSGRERGR